MAISPYNSLNLIQSNQAAALEKHFEMTGATNPYDELSNQPPGNKNAHPHAKTKKGHNRDHKGMNADAIAAQNKQQELANNLEANKNDPLKVADIGMKAVTEPGLSEQQLRTTQATILKNTNNHGKMQFMSDYKQANPTVAGKMFEEMRDMTALEGNLRDANPKAAAQLVGAVDMSKADMPAGMDASQQKLSGLIEIKSAPGFIPPANGNYTLKGNFSGGPVNTNPFSEAAVKNAANIASRGGTPDSRFVMTDATGKNTVALSDAAKGGLDTIKETMKPAVFKTTPSFGGV